MLGLLVLVALLYILMSIEMRDLFSPRQPATSIYISIVRGLCKALLTLILPDGGESDQPNFFDWLYLQFLSNV